MAVLGGECLDEEPSEAPAAMLRSDHELDDPNLVTWQVVEGIGHDRTVDCRGEDSSLPRSLLEGSIRKEADSRLKRDYLARERPQTQKNLRPDARV